MVITVWHLQRDICMTFICSWVYCNYILICSNELLVKVTFISKKITPAASCNQSSCKCLFSLTDQSRNSDVTVSYSVLIYILVSRIDRMVYNEGYKTYYWTKLFCEILAKYSFVHSSYLPYYKNTTHFQRAHLGCCIDIRNIAFMSWPDKIMFWKLSPHTVKIA